MDVATAKQLIHVGNTINIVAGIIASLSLLITGYGIILIPVPVFIVWWTNKKVEEAEELIEKGEFDRAREILIVPSVLSMIFVILIGGLLILIGALMLPSKENM